MPETTQITPDENQNPRTRDGQPVVYLVNGDGPDSRSMDLQQLFAPIWRWKWVVATLLVLTIIAGAWYFTKPPKAQYQFIVQVGSYPRAALLEQLEGVIVPQASMNLPDLWRPEVKIGPLTKMSSESAHYPEHLISVSLLLSSGSAEAQSQFISRIQSAVSQLSAISEKIVASEYQAQLSQLQRALSEATVAHAIISKESYVDALRGLITKEILLTQAGIQRQEAIFLHQTQRDATLDEHAVRLTSNLDGLLATMGETESKFPGAAQILIDRITSLRLELEDRLPNERLQIERRLNECNAEQDRLTAILSQQRLEFNNFDTDLATRQAAALDALAIAQNALDLFEARKSAGLVHQPVSIIDEFEIYQTNETRLLVTLAILVFGALCSLLSAYALEVLRLARLGTR